MPTKPIPEGYPRVTPYLTVDDGPKAIEYYRRVFGADERVRMDGPDGKVGHAELGLGDAVIMVADANPDSSTRPPKELGGTTASVFIYVDDADATVRKAVDGGATVTSAVENQFWGDRLGTITDPFGHVWSIATHVEDVSPEELAERVKAMMPAGSS
jgi:PhnB protein